MTTSKNKNIFILFAILTTAMIGLLFYMSSQSENVSKETSGVFVTFLAKLLYGTENITAQMTEPVSVLVRKTAHMGAFGILFLLSFITLVYFEKSFKTGKFLSVKSYVLTVYGFVFLNAAFDEIHQIFTGRGALVIDVVIDMTGALISAVMIIGLINAIKTSGVLKKSLNIILTILLMFTLYTSVFIFIHPEVLTILNK